MHPDETDLTPEELEEELLERKLADADRNHDDACYELMLAHEESEE